MLTPDKGCARCWSGTAGGLAGHRWVVLLARVRESFCCELRRSPVQSLPSLGVRRAVRCDWQSIGSGVARGGFPSVVRLWAFDRADGDVDGDGDGDGYRGERIRTRTEQIRVSGKEQQTGQTRLDSASSPPQQPDQKHTLRPRTASTSNVPSRPPCDQLQPWHLHHHLPLPPIFLCRSGDPANISPISAAPPSSNIASKRHPSTIHSRPYNQSIDSSISNSSSLWHVEHLRIRGRFAAAKQLTPLGKLPTDESNASPET